MRQAQYLCNTRRQTPKAKNTYRIYLGMREPTDERKDLRKKQESFLLSLKSRQSPTDRTPCKGFLEFVKLA